MKLSINREELTLAVSTVCKAISNRTTLPVLENLYISFKNNHVLFRGNDLELGIEYMLPIETDNNELDHSILVKASTMNDILTKLNSETIDLTISENFQLSINTDGVEFDIFGMAADQFPQFPDVEKDISFNVQTDQLINLIKHTIFSVSHDETKQFLNGIKIEANENRCDFISTDGFRLSAKHELIEKSIPNFSCIVPFKTMNELFKILSSIKVDNVDVYISERQISFKIGSSTIISRLVNGRFPDYKQVLVNDSEFEFKVEKARLLHALDRANIISSKCNNVAKFNFTDSSVVISASSPNLGDYVENLNLTRTSGDRDILMSFNIRLLQEVLKIIEQQEIIIQINGELSPCIVKPIGDETYIHILMPIRMSDHNAPAPKESDVKTEEVPA